MRTRPQAGRLVSRQGADGGTCHDRSDLPANRRRSRPLRTRGEITNQSDRTRAVDTGSGSARSSDDPEHSERAAGAMACPHPPCPDERFAVHLLPGGRGDHGVGPAGSPDSALWVQAGGDAHLSNFGAYASPSRESWCSTPTTSTRLCRGPGNGPEAPDRQPGGWPGSTSVSSSRRTAKSRPAWSGHTAKRWNTTRRCRFLDSWYDYLDVDDVRKSSGMSAEELHTRLAWLRSRRQPTSLQALRRLATRSPGRCGSAANHPYSYRSHRCPPSTTQRPQTTPHERSKRAATTEDHIQVLLSRFRFVDIAIKVVGVGRPDQRC